MQPACQAKGKGVYQADRYASYASKLYAVRLRLGRFQPPLLVNQKSKSSLRNDPLLVSLHSCIYIFNLFPASLFPLFCSSLRIVDQLTPVALLQNHAL